MNSEHLGMEMCKHDLNESWAQVIIWSNKQLNKITKNKAQYS
jgi:hypothetical protein